MKKLQFDLHGNPKPYDIVQLTYDECKAIFVDNFSTSQTRKSNWNNFIQFHHDIKKVSKYPVRH